MMQIPECCDYIDAIMVPQLVKAKTLQGGAPILYNGSPEMFAGGYCVVFPFQSRSNKVAVRCWHAYISGGKERSKKISEYLDSVSLPYFAKFEYVEEGIATKQGVQPIIIMDWVTGKTLKEFLKDNLHNKAVLKKLAEDFKKMVSDLHKNNISHGDLQHGNILIKSDGSIVLVDYDSLYVPELNGYPDEIHGLQGYQHPARFKNNALSPKSDYFSELIIYTSILALAENSSLWDELQIEDSETLLFSSEDIDSYENSAIYRKLKSMPSVAKFAEKIAAELRKTSINELSSLEENCVSEIDNIRNDFADNGYVRPAAFNKEDINKFREDW